MSELVKNAHDADASTATIVFQGVSGGDGRIEVIDDGLGMNLDTVLGRWMEPAASTKVGKGRQVTRLGRRVLGEKGVGRFAADKLARHLEILSRCPARSDEIRVVIDWDRFDDDSLMLDEVLSQWEVRPAQVLKRHGTVLRLAGLRSTWNERMFRRLSLRLSRLLSPFRDDAGFTIRIESDEFPQYSGEVRADFLDKAPYRIDAGFDGRETITFSLQGRRVQERRWNGQGELSCGPVRMRLFAFDLEGEALAKIAPRLEVRAWLREWTGVSIYRDGFRVWPYGEPHDDWLRLDQRRVNNPVEHLSNNQVIGFIDIGRDRNPDLIDQTNREGLIHNKALDDLRRLAAYVLQVLEAERQSIRHPARAAQAEGEAPADADGLSARLEEIARKLPAGLASELRQAKGKVEETMARNEAAGKKRIEGYSELAAVGQLASGVAGLLPGNIALVRQGLDRLKAAFFGTTDPAWRQAVDTLTGALDRINDSLRMLMASAGGGERRRAIDMAAELEAFRDMAGPWLEKHGVRLDIDCAGFRQPPQPQPPHPQPLSPARNGADATRSRRAGERGGRPTEKGAGVLRTEMRPENFHCLLQILTANALDWLGRVKERRIRVTVSAVADECRLVFADNGPGVPAEIAGRIFEPLFSRKEGGRGMGLTIARQLVAAHGGSIFLVEDGRRKGASFVVQLPRKRSRATIYGRSDTKRSFE